MNAALNYGYSIILSAFAREIVANGFFTQLGIFHDNIFNEYNLACDLMEPFRHFVDYSVYKMRPEKLEHDEKMLLADILNRKVFICGKIQYITNAIKIYTEYMKMQRSFFGKEVFVFVNLKSCFSEEEIENFYQWVFYNKFKVLLLESFQREIPLKDENTVIIDKDLCEIC